MPRTDAPRRLGPSRIERPVAYFSRAVSLADAAKGACAFRQAWCWLLGVLPVCWSGICSAQGFCCISGSRVLRLLLAHKSISPLKHALLRPLFHRNGVKIGLAKGYVSFALLKQRRVVHDSSPIGSHPSHFGLARLELTYRTAQQHGKRSDRDKG
jgi:hypothetical protein